MHLFVDILRNSILITGLVVVMMMMIESLNIESKGLIFKGLKKTKIGQVVIGALLGSIPGCMGGFATVSLYTHRMFSFGALVAMMIASSGDEAFIMLAMIPQQALVLFAVLFVIAVIVGILIDMFHTPKETPDSHTYPKHEECHSEEPKGHTARHFGWKRIVMFIGLAIFIGALASGKLAHDHGAHGGHSHTAECTEHCHEEHIHAEHHGTPGTINLLDEQWMNVLFAGLSVIMLMVILFASEHFVNEHLWDHVIKRHLPVIFAWTFGVLLVLGIGLHFFDIDKWIGNDMTLAILIPLAALIGIIPESGPHLIFVLLYAHNPATLPALLASCISQDGHASIPLLAESKRSFLWAKIINCAVALIVGYAAMLFF
jgi:hypothetical protein